MATVFKPKGRKVYYAKFQHRGEVHFLSTGQATKKAAADWMADKIEEVKGRGSIHALFDRVVSMLADIKDEQKRDKTRSELINKLREGKKSRALLADAWTLFEKTPRKKSQGESWRKTQSGWFRNFVEWMGEHHPKAKHMDEVTPSMAQAYTRHLNEDNSPYTFNRKRQCIALVFDTLKVVCGGN
jgi:hypothetical protein